MPNLDGKDKLVPVPFDAHEQATRGEHVPTTADGPDPDHDPIEFPKAVDHIDHPDPVAAAAGHKEPVIVNSADEEEAHEVDHIDHPDPVAAAAGHKEPVIVNSADEE